MPQLTQEQVDELADGALKLKSSVSDYRDRFFKELTPQKRQGLNDLAIQLGDEIDHLTAVAIKITGAELQQTLADLSDVTSGVNQAVAKLSEVRKAITI